MLTKRPFFFNIMFGIIVLHVRLCSCEGIPRYDTLGFAPSNSSALATIALGSRSSFKFMATVSTSSNKSQPVVIYHRESTSFKEVAFLFCLDCTSAITAIVGNVKFNSDASSILVTTEIVSPALRIYTISSSYQLTMVQKITLAALSEISGLSQDDNFLMIGSASITNVYKLTSGQYVSIYAFSGGSLNKACRAMTPDGLFILQDLGQGTTSSLCILAYNGATYNSVAEFNLGFLTTTIYRVLIGKTDTTGKYRVIICSSTYIRYYELVTSTFPFAATLTLIQTLRDLSMSRFDGYLTANSLYAIISNRAGPTVTNRQFTFLQFNPANNTYLQAATIASFFPENPTSMFISEDGQFATVGIQMMGIYTLNDKQVNAGYFFFACNVSNCLKCSWLNVCMTCKDGYVLGNFTCGCPNGQQLKGDICVACLNGECSTSINSLAKITEQLRNMQIFIVIALVIIMTGLILGFLYLSQKIKKLNSEEETPFDHSKQTVSPQKSQITQFNKKSLSSSQLEIQKESSQLKISGMEDNLIGRELPDDVSNAPQVRRTRKKRGKEEPEVNSPLEVKFSLKASNEADLTQSELN